MNKEKIRELIVTKTHALSSIGGALSPKFEIETIHQFRLTFKYLRSFLRLLRMHNEDKGLKIPEHIKYLYSIAGEIRDLQIELNNLAPELVNGERYRSELTQKLNRQKKIWDKSFATHTFQRFEKVASKYEFVSLPDGVFVNFLSSMIVSIEKNASSHPITDDHLHSIRKNAKDIIHTVDATHRFDSPSKMDEKLQFEMEDLKQMTDEIGGFNDKRMHLKHLEEYAVSAAEPEEQKRIESYTAEQLKRMDRHRNNILQSVLRFLKRRKG